MNQDLEIEAAFLGAVLSIPDGARRFLWLRGDDFADQNHGVVWETLRRLASEGETSVTAATVIHRTLADEGVDRRSFVGGLMASAGVNVQLPEYARIIADLSTRRRTVAFIDSLRARIDDSSVPSEAIVSEGAEELRGLIGERGKRAETGREVSERVIQAIGRKLECYSTGIGALDEAMGGGLFASKLYGIAARKKVGKTMLLGSISYNLAQQGIPHLFLPLEMGPDEIEQRNAARDQMFNAIRFLTRDDPMLADRVAKYAPKAENCIYDYQPGASLDYIAASIARNKVSRGIKGVILDYWQLVGGRDPRDNETGHLGNVAQSLANICKRENLFMIAAAQVNQEGNTRGGEGLKLACDQYYTLHREKDDDRAWLEMEESRYTLYVNVGDEFSPGLLLNKHGPHFMDPEALKGNAA